MLLYHNIHNISTHKYTYGGDIIKSKYRKHYSICTHVIMSTVIISIDFIVQKICFNLGNNILN